MTNARDNPREEDFIAEIAPDPSQPPDTLLLTGYLGRSSETDSSRLYFDPQLANYVEIANADILYTQPIAREESPLGGSYVWIRKEAELIYGKIGSDRPRAKFLEGPIMQEYLQAAQYGMGNNPATTQAECWQPAPANAPVDRPVPPGAMPLQLLTLNPPCRLRTIQPPCPIVTISPPCLTTWQTYCTVITCRFCANPQEGLPVDLQAQMNVPIPNIPDPMVAAQMGAPTQLCPSVANGCPPPTQWCPQTLTCPTVNCPTRFCPPTLTCPTRFCPPTLMCPTYACPTLACPTYACPTLACQGYEGMQIAGMETPAMQAPINRPAEMGMMAAGMQPEAAIPVTQLHSPCLNTPVCPTQVIQLCQVTPMCYTRNLLICSTACPTRIPQVCTTACPQSPFCPVTLPTPTPGYPITPAGGFPGGGMM